MHPDLHSGEAQEGDELRVFNRKYLPTENSVRYPSARIWLRSPLAITLRPELDRLHDKQVFKPRSLWCRRISLTDKSLDCLPLWENISAKYTVNILGRFTTSVKFWTWVSGAHSMMEMAKLVIKCWVWSAVTRKANFTLSWTTKENSLFSIYLAGLTEARELLKVFYSRSKPERFPDLVS